MKSPKVSVIIPVYNAEKTVGGILEKLTTQEYKNIEIIVVNDGSKDGSLEILRDFTERDKRVILVDQKNAGVSTARNVGMSNATGEFITFIDADDNFSEELIIKLVAASADDVDFVMCGMSINDKEVVARSDVIEGHKHIVSYVMGSLLTKNLFYGPYCKLFRRSIIEKFTIAFPEDVKYGEDTIFVLNYLRCTEKLVVINKSLYSYNFLSTGLAAGNAKNASFRNFRANALSKFTQDRLSIAGCTLYVLVRARWVAAYLKNRVKG